MSTCPSCGGVVGRDCFNTQECAEITQDQARRFREGDEVQRLRGELQVAQKDLERETRQCEAVVNLCVEHEAELDRLRKYIYDLRTFDALIDGCDECQPLIVCGVHALNQMELGRRAGQLAPRNDPPRCSPEGEHGHEHTHP